MWGTSWTSTRVSSSWSVVIGFFEGDYSRLCELLALALGGPGDERLNTSNLRINPFGEWRQIMRRTIFAAVVGAMFMTLMAAPPVLADQPLKGRRRPDRVPLSVAIAICPLTANCLPW